MTNDELNVVIAEKLLGTAEVLAYSTDVKDAFDVLKKLHSQGWFWRLDSVHDGVVCTIQNVKRKTFSIRAPNAAQAVCECAVRTLEETAA
jgi:hypothetical protein